MPREARICTVEGCFRPQHGQGLCSKHLLRLRRTGTIEQGRSYTQRAGKTGDKEVFASAHPLYAVWRECHRGRNPRPVDPIWREDFNRFVSDVGERPTPSHRLRRRDMTKPLGPDNFMWQEMVVGEKQPDEDKKEYNKRASKEARQGLRDNYRDSDLRRMYGPNFSIERKKQMLEEQNHKCAICDLPETETRAGRLKLLAVDHDHKTGKIRGLLCKRCNVALGYFRDDISLLNRAAGYLAKNHVPAA